MIRIHHLLFVVSILASPVLMAENRTISDAFDGTEPTMTASQFSCSDTVKPYKQVGTFQVSVSGTYRIWDGGNSAAFTFGENSPVADVIVMIYNGSFSSANPGQNRIAQIDETAEVALQAGTSYIMVVQYWCERSVYGPAPFAAVIDGAGSVTGLGFNTASYTFGTFSNASPTTFFPGLGSHAYAVSIALNFPTTGQYFFSDIGTYLGSDIAVWVYEDSFTSNDPLNNFVGEMQVAGELFLEAGKTYVFVLIDIFDFLDDWQFALFPPGAINFNAGLNGAWVIDGIGLQGILAEVFPLTNLMFFAWFTFTDAPLVVNQAQAVTEAQSSGSVSKSQFNPGSFDQRWLTGFGFLPESGGMMNIFFENATGGAFDSTNAEPSIDSEYGTGSIQLIDCNAMNVSYNLPGGLADTVLFERILPDGAARCYDLVPQGAIVPPIQ